VNYRGLWVGEAKLNFVTEVTVPLDKNNNPVAPDPKVPTPTSDAANLRLLLHVNGAGQVNLLKSVAVLNRNGTNQVQSEHDFSLVTDERLYPAFPVQPAVRYASVAFDFGDGKATEAVNAVLDTVVAAVATSINGASVGTLAQQQTAVANARTAGNNAAAPVMQNADVANSFTAFIRSNVFNEQAVDVIAGAANPTTAAASAMSAAQSLQANSFYNDSRGVDMVNAVLAAIAANATGAARTNAAQNAAAAFADVNDTYHRFISGKIFGDMIVGAASAAATAGTNAGADAASIRGAVNSHPDVAAAGTVAIQIQVIEYRDTRARDAVNRVLDAIIGSVVAALPVAPSARNSVQAAADEAGRSVLNTNVARYTVAALTPTLDYNAFVRSNIFLQSSDVAALAAAEAAMAEKRDNPLFTLESIQNAARIKAVDALRDVYAAAARALRTEVPLLGRFGVGAGDARLSWLIKQTNNATGQTNALGLPALSGQILLPANHPTNPFRHRRHPDHTVGFDVTRKIRLDFDSGPTNQLARAGFGVDRITGTYREEILGLHKPLGPNKDTGLKVEGTFQLNRVSLIDTLNAR